ncbi:MAG: tyrosine-type recombinase/integrase [Ferruginibacter sp.]|nr:tyrosine-type recombinase/integrase [Ferruginibacter sp.]
MPVVKKSKELLVVELYQKFITNSTNGKRTQPNGKKLSSGTIANYEFTYKHLQNFCIAKKQTLRVKPIKYLTKRELATESNYWKKFYKKFTDYLYIDCNCFDNYVGLCIKNLRVFFNYCNKELLLGIGDFHKQFYVRKEEIPIITLLPEELNFFIYDTAFESKLTPRMQQVKDMFVFGCTVALRVSDLLLLNKTNLRIVNNQHYLMVRSKKVGAVTSILLPDYAVQILNKYKLKKGKLLPHFNKTNLNIYIKQLVELAGFTQLIKKARDKRGSSKEILKTDEAKKASYRFCDLVSTHTMRRTAITTMLCLGVPEQVVRKISGHSPMSKEFFRYVSLAQTYQDNEVSKMFEKLKSKSLSTTKNE